MIVGGTWSPSKDVVLDSNSHVMHNILENDKGGAWSLSTGLGCKHLRPAARW